MQTLFDIQPRLPKGFRYIENFLSPEEENKLIAHVREMDLHPFLFQGFEAKRKVASFGFDYNFNNKVLTKGKEIPSCFTPLLNEVSHTLNIAKHDFAELLVTEYPPGAVINWHRDAYPFATVVGISLASDCIFRFRPHSDEQRRRHSTISLPVRRRSLYVMQEDARDDWQHSTAPVLQQRYSITLRTLRNRRL